MAGSQKAGPGLLRRVRIARVRQEGPMMKREYGRSEKGRTSLPSRSFRPSNDPPGDLPPSGARRVRVTSRKVRKRIASPLPFGERDPDQRVSHPSTLDLVFTRRPKITRGYNRPWSLATLLLQQ